MPPWNNSTGEDFSAAEPGNAIVEFIGVMVVIIVPALGLLAILATIVSAQFALQGAARESARVFVRANTVAEANSSATAAAKTSWEDRGFTEALAVTYACSDPSCLVPNATVTATVSAQIELPLIGTRVTLRDSQPMTVDAFRAARP
ncbi:MAG: hypothetical protein Q4E03_05640 [Trueperella sp.]|nr:hypothetical protein [Trueperella sp.]